MSSIKCFNCDKILSEKAILDGWCEECGKKIPAFQVSEAQRAQAATHRKKKHQDEPVTPAPATRVRRPGEPAPKPGDYQPLEDPLRVLGYFLGAFILVWLLMAARVLFYVVSEDGFVIEALENWYVILLSVPGYAVLFMACVWRILPKRRVNAFYLRSFSGDEETARLRVTLQAALGRGFRLSGIRAPNRRWPWLFRYLSIWNYVISYSTTRYMNLEAGADWKGRLRRSLEHARCVFIDVTDLTPFVAEEIQLCHRSLGLERVLFIGDPDLNADAWRARIEKALGPLSDEDASKIRLAIWNDSSEGRREFTKVVRDFVSALPAGFALPVANSHVQEVEDTAYEAPPEEGSGCLGVVVGASLAIVLFLAIMINALLPSDEKIIPPSYLWGFVNLIFFVVAVRFFFRYMIDCGSNRERILTLASLLLAQVCSLTFLIGPIAKVRHAAARMVISNDLKQISLAMRNYSDDRGTLPPAFMDGPAGEGGKRHRVSWRVLLLPYVEQPDLYKQYRMDEPWDSPNNLKLLPQMPQCYGRPGVSTKLDHTHYRVFVSPVGVNPRAAFEEGRGVPVPAGFPDGMSNTILVVEAAESVPWTKPDELVYDPEKPLPSFGTFGRSTFQAGLADGSVLSFPNKRGPTDDRRLRAYITRNGDELIPDR